MTSTTKTRTAKAPRATVWETLPVADLLAHAPAVPEPDAELTASVTADGIEEPLYIATLGDGTYRIVDGMRRLAAAAAAGITDVPVTHRPVIRVSALTAHPGNVRQDLKLTKTFRASLRADGVRIPVKIKRTEAGALEVGDGHRRLAGAIAEGLTHVPYEYDEVDEAGRFTDMVTTAVHREALTQAEEAAALFSAAELGADVKRLAAASGRSQKDVKTLVTVGGSAAVASVSAAAASPFSLEDLSRLAELEKHAPEAVARIEAHVKKNPAENHAWRITAEIRKVEKAQEAASHRAELEKAGARIRETAELSEKAAPVYQLRNIGDHTGCQGEVWVLEDDDRRYTRYCANPPFFGHTTTGTDQAKPTAGERKAVITGNIHWSAAETQRRTWLAELITRKSQTKAVQDQFLTLVTRVMFEADYAILTKKRHPQQPTVLAELLGIPENRRDVADEVTKRSQSAAAQRRPAILFASVASCFELYFPRTTWRTDITNAEAGQEARRYRREAAQYLTWLTEMGYQPTPIEAAVIAGETYDATAAEMDQSSTIDD